MKKYICMLAGGMLLFQFTGALKLSQYCEFQKKEKFRKAFDESTDLIRGMIMLQHGALKEHRHYGNIKYDPSSMKSAEVCSFKDKSDDAMSQLLILLFPSAGASGLNAFGVGSLGNIFKDEDQLMRVIAGMFKIANDVRECIADKRTAEIANITRDNATIISHFGDNTTEITEKDMTEYLSETFRRDEEKLSNQGEVATRALNLLQRIKEGDIGKFIGSVEIVLDICGNSQFTKDSLLAIFNEKEFWTNDKSPFRDITMGFINSTQTQEELIELVEAYKLIASIDSQKASQRSHAILINDLENKLKSINEQIRQIEKNRDRYLGGGNVSELRDFVNKDPEMKKHFNKLRRNKRSKLIELGKTVANAVTFERINNRISFYENAWKNQPYFLGYANDIICAYACSVINTNVEENLTKLANYLAPNKRDQKEYQSKITKKLKDYYDKYPAYIPFDAGSTPITNGTNISYRDQKFADCVETTMRQLFAVIFCSKKAPNGEWLEDTRLEKERIPKVGKLHDFFHQYSEINEAANSGSMVIRTAWAEVCSGHQDSGVKYDPDRKFCELDPEWRSMIRLFCLLMSEYDPNQDEEKSTPEIKKRKKEAAELIKNINKNGFNAASKEEVIKALNTLLGIRGDIQFEAKDSDLSINSAGKMVGRIIICPRQYQDGTRNISPENNKMTFSVTNDGTSGHAYIDQIPKAPDSIENTIDKNKDKNGMSYVLELYSEDLSPRGLYFSGYKFFADYFPVIGYYLNTRMHGKDFPDLQQIMKYNSSRGYFQGIYKFCLAARHAFPNKWNVFRYIKENPASKPNYLALGKVFVDSNQDDPKNFYDLLTPISKYVDMNEVIEPETNDMLFEKWNKLSTTDEIQALDYVVPARTSIDASILENMKNIKNLNMGSVGWGLVGKIFNRIQFSSDEQYEAIKPILLELQEVVDKFVSSKNYSRDFTLNRDFSEKGEILKVVLPFCFVYDDDTANSVKKWINQEEERLNSGNPEGQERKKIDDRLLIPISAYISDEALENLIKRVINQAGKYFERDLHHIARACTIKSKEKGVTAANLIAKNFPADKTMDWHLAVDLASRVDDIPAFVKKLNLESLTVLVTVFCNMGSSERTDCFIDELMKVQTGDDLMSSLRKLINLNFDNISKIGDAIARNNVNVSLPIAKLLLKQNNNCNWVANVSELYESDTALSAFMTSLKETGSNYYKNVVDIIGKTYIKKKGSIPLSVANTLLREIGNYDWLYGVENLFHIENVVKIINTASHRINAANMIGRAYVKKNEPMPMDVAQVLFQAGARETDWIKAQEQLYSSDDNVAKLLDMKETKTSFFVWTYNSGIANLLGEICKQKSISMNLAKILIEANSTGENWLDSVTGLCDSEDNVVTLINAAKFYKKELAGNIGEVYANKKGHISMQLAKKLIEAGADGEGWIHVVEELFNSEDNVVTLINAAEVYKKELASNIGEVYANKKGHISMQLAKKLIEAGSNGKGWIHAVDELSDLDDSDESEERVLTLINATMTDKEKLIDNMGGVYFKKNKSIPMRIAKIFVKMQNPECQQPGANDNEMIQNKNCKQWNINNNTIGLPSVNVAEIINATSKNWLLMVDEIFTSEEKLNEILGMIDINHQSIAETIGRGYAEKKGSIPLQTAKAIIKAGGFGEDLIKAIDGLYDSVDNVTELVKASPIGYRCLLAEKIGEAYASANKTISIPLAKVLIEAGAQGWQWMKKVDGLLDDENVNILINAAIPKIRLSVEKAVRHSLR